MHALMLRDNVLLFPINPKQLAGIAKVILAGAKTILPMQSIWHACCESESQH